MNMAISVVPFFDIPAHACTASGCFGFGFGSEGSPTRLNCFARNLSHRTVLSSVNMTSLNSSLCTNMSVQKKSRFSLFSARIISQYRVLVWTQPIRCRSLLITLVDMLTSSFSCRRFCSSLALISWSALTSASIKASVENPSLRL